jgi:hypothetical protein
VRRGALSTGRCARQGCEHVFAMTSQGSAYTRFRRALQTGNLTLVRAAAAELPQVQLGDALDICLLLQGAEPESYERAVLRWIGRLCLERRDLTLWDLRAVLEAFERLSRQPDESLQRLRRYL